MRRMIHTLTALALAVCLLLSLAACGAAGNGAGKYPFKTIRMIVPYGANGTTDLVGRKLGAALGRALGVSVVIDNQPIFLNHHPFLSYGDSHGTVWQLFGHVHTRGNGEGKEKDKQRLPLLMATQYDVGVDNNNYTPISFERVKEIINARQRDD